MPLGSWVESLLPLLPAPARAEALPNDGWLLVGGDPALVVVRVTAAGLRIGPARLRFWGPRPVLVEERLAGVSWELLPAAREQALPVIAALIDAAIRLRWTELRPCGRCGEPRAPEEVAIVARTQGACPFCARAAT